MVEGRNFGERIVWIIAILATFTFAGFMVESNLRDSAEKPVATSIDSVHTNVIKCSDVDTLILLRENKQQQQQQQK